MSSQTCPRLARTPDVAPAHPRGRGSGDGFWGGRVALVLDDSLVDRPTHARCLEGNELRFVGLEVPFEVLVELGTLLLLGALLAREGPGAAPRGPLTAGASLAGVATERGRLATDEPGALDEWSATRKGVEAGLERGWLDPTGVGWVRCRARLASML